MSCLLTNVLTRQCDFLLSGLYELHLGNRAHLSAYTSSAITMSAGTVMYKVDFAPDNASFTNELTISNGQRYVSQTINFYVDSKDSNILAAAPELALGTFFAIATDANLDKYSMGITGAGMRATVVSLNSGAAIGDQAGLIVTLVGGGTSYAQLYTGTIPV